MKIEGAITKVKIHILGAGQDIGRSCIIVEHGNSYM